MLFTPMSFGIDGHVQALSAGTIKTLVAGVSYDGRQPLVTTAADAVTDVINGGFRVRQDGRVRITDATVALPETTYLNGGVRVTETGRLCVALEDVGVDVTILQGCACTNDGRVYMSLGAEPVNSVLPVITGATAGSTSSVSNGTWSGSPTFGYRWFLDGVGIEGEISATIDTDAAWAGQTLSAVVWATNDGGSVSASAAGIVLVDGASYTGPLDVVPGAVVAYSVRALSAAWLGENIFRLRRDSDDAEMDFAADAVTGAAPVASITAWLAGANGSLVTWYDQSGNGKNATQSSDVNQPPYTSNAFNGLPGFTFDGGADDIGTVESSDLTFANGTLYFIGVYKFDLDQFGAPFGAQYGAGLPNFTIWNDGSNVLYFDSDNADNSEHIEWQTNSAVLTNNMSVIDFTAGHSANDAYINNVSAAVTVAQDTGAMGSLTFPLTIGSDDSSDDFYGRMQEIIGYATTPSAGNRLSLRENDADYYGIAPTPTGPINTALINNGGLLWAVNDTFKISGGNNDAVGVVDTVSIGGVITGIHLTNSGTGYAAATGVPLTTPSGLGTGGTVDITL